MSVEKDKSLPNARQQWLIDTVANLKLENPVSDIAEKTGISRGNISSMLNKKMAVSVNVLKKFCSAYRYDFDAVNHMLIEKIKNELFEGNDSENKNESKNFAVKKGVHTFNPPYQKPTGDETDMEKQFLIETVNWQRNFMEKMLTKIPDIEKEGAQQEQPKKRKAG